MVRENRRSDQRALVESLAVAGQLRPGLSASKAADIVYAVVNEEVYLMLVGDCGWSVERVREWMAATMSHQLVDPGPARSIATVAREEPS